MFFLSQPVGLVVDMFGPRLIMIPASIMTVCGLVALSFCKEYYQIFLAQGLCFGIGAAGIFMPGKIGLFGTRIGGDGTGLILQL